MSNMDTGGPAFPVVHEIPPEPGRPEGTRAIQAFYGMHLRDYFAAKAMQGFIQYSAAKGIYTPPDNELAKLSYDLADAMLATRSKA